MNIFESLFKNSKQNTIIGLNHELKALYLYNKYKNTNESIVFVTSNLYEANKIYKSLHNYTDKVWFFPMDDFITSEAIASSPELKITRLETINEMLIHENGIIITNLMGYLRYLPKKELFLKNRVNLEISNDYNIKELTESLFSAGYKRVTTVNMTGEFAIRGYVVDVFPINEENPIRVEFWGDTLDRMRYFNVDSQRTVEKIEKIDIYPNTEFLTEDKEMSLSQKDLIKHGKVYSISDYFNSPIIFYDEFQNLSNNYENLLEEMRNYSLGLELEPNTKYMHDFNEIISSNAFFFENFNITLNSVKNTEIYKAVDIPRFDNSLEGLNKFFNQNIKDGKTVIVCLDSRYKINKLLDSLENAKAMFTSENEIIEKQINFIVKRVNEGFQISNYVILTERELFSKKENNNYQTKFKYGTRIKDINKLEKGDYVVHNIHGIGRYLGLKTILKAGISKDYLTIEYKGGDKLYIPVEKIDMISKYSSSDGMVPKINKLGSLEWEKSKARARKRAEDIADDLLKLYAARESQHGFAFEKDDDNQIQFEKEFPYSETADQLRVAEEIKKDMQKAHPMDRLLCGDVGYGKTEVAFRAAFKAIISSKQVAFLCPTTILSSQHYNNAIERFKSFPIRIEILNRFVTPGKAKKILSDLKEGKIDMLIGTHRILSEDVIFKDLGLLVIDEEQRFGVKHKEKIKTFKNNVDVLTLSATPIPRTLQMSIAGIRDLSLIETPPLNRYPIQTYVLAENDQVIKDVIYKELARDGQTFILYNKIKDIEEKRRQIQKLVPDAKIAIAHGQMTKTELEKIMFDFINREYDVLLCTTIIETGIDIPSANTLIIMDADHFGLSQLYQIRGRIGRSNIIAYCYLMYDKRKILSEIAVKRLKIIKDFTELGSGFAIAMRDLSLRGAGDILGSEQAGFVDSVGIDLFLEMLNEEIKKQKGEKVEEKPEMTTPLIDVKTSIDDNYVAEEELKLLIHKKINSIDSYEKLVDVKNDIEDRFGKISDDLIIYMHEEWFEKIANKLSINDIKQTKNSIIITLTKELTEKIDGDVLFYEASKLTRMFRFGMRMNRLIITLDTINLDKHFIYYLIDLLKIIDNNTRGETYG